MRENKIFKISRRPENHNKWRKKLLNFEIKYEKFSLKHCNSLVSLIARESYKEKKIL